MNSVWHVKGHQDANTKVEDRDKLGQANLIDNELPNPF